MGQGSSLEVSSPVPTGGNLMVDASDSFVSDLKLRSTGIIPISEYIKKEKYKKNVQRLEQVKKVEQSDYTLPQPEADSKGSKRDEQDEESQASEELQPRRRKKGSDFIETSYEDVPENRVWIIKPSRHRSSARKPQDVPKGQPAVVYPEPDNYSDHLIIPQKTKHTRNKAETSNTRHNTRTAEKQTKHTTTSDDPPEVKKAPELRELYHRKHREDHRKPKRTKHQRNAKTSSTDLLKFRHNNNNTQSTHNVKNHHFQLFNFAALRNRAHKPKLTVQTNLSCTIPPNRYLIPCLKKSSSSTNAAVHVRPPAHLKSAHKNLRFATPPQSVDRMEMATSSLSLAPQDGYVPNRRACDAPRRGPSARQALESWKNIHVQKHRERSRTMSPGAPRRAQEPLAEDGYSNETTLGRDSDEIPIFRSLGSRNYHQNVRGWRRTASAGARRDKCLQTDGSVRPSKEFLDDIERCLQRHSHLSDLYVKRNGGAKSTWVQDKYRRWHKITFEDN